MDHAARTRGARPVRGEPDERDGRGDARAVAPHLAPDLLARRPGARGGLVRRGRVHLGGQPDRLLVHRGRGRGRARHDDVEGVAVGEREVHEPRVRVLRVVVPEEGGWHEVGRVDGLVLRVVDDDRARRRGSSRVGHHLPKGLVRGVRGGVWQAALRRDRPGARGGRRRVGLAPAGGEQDQEGPGGGEENGGEAREAHRRTCSRGRGGPRIRPNPPPRGREDRAGNEGGPGRRTGPGPTGRPGEGSLWRGGSG